MSIVFPTSQTATTPSRAFGLQAGLAPSSATSRNAGNFNRTITLPPGHTAPVSSPFSARPAYRQGVGSAIQPPALPPASSRKSATPAPTSATVHENAVFNPKAPSAKKRKDALLGGRTKGMWLFDTLLYPIFTNFGVFAISVLATYMTSDSDEKKKKTNGKTNFMLRRGNWARAGLQRVLKSQRAAREAVMIGFSFLDGSLLAPFIKLFEDHRLQIVKTFDKWMNTSPSNPDVYQSEPKQTWGSVLGGRAVALSLVLPAYKLLSRERKDGYTINQKLFEHPGKAAGNWLTKKIPWLERRFPTIAFGVLAEVCALEAFYTTLCTAGLYLSSRFFASRHNKTHQ